MFGRRIHLFLFVKVREDWAETREHYREIGLEYPEDMTERAMEWSDDAIVLSVRAHGESSAIVDALTRDHGRHAGLVRGGASRKAKAVLQPGNSLHVVWRARLAEHLGSYTAEPARARAGRLLERRAALIGLNAFTAVTQAVLPEREPHGSVYEAALVLLDAMVEGEFADWGPLYVRWEAGLLDELGFGLDLSALCGHRRDRRSDLRLAAERARGLGRRRPRPIASGCSRCRHFCSARRTRSSLADIAAGLTLTAHFLAERVLAPHGKALPARAHPARRTGRAANRNRTGRMAAKAAAYR